MSVSCVSCVQDTMEIMTAIIGVIKTNSSTPTYSDMAVITIFITQNKDLHYARPAY